MTWPGGLGCRNKLPVAVCDSNWLTAVTVKGKLPSSPLEGRPVKTRLATPGMLAGLGVMVAEMPLGNPDTDRLAEPVYPPKGVSVIA